MLLEHGYSVAANSRTITKLTELNASADLVLVDGDISKKETSIKVADAVIERFGRIHPKYICQKFTSIAFQKI